jgi:cytoskeletal protein RodZ
MAGNTQMNESERGLFKLNGITGMLIAVVLLLSILGTLVVSAIFVQQNEATNYYQINKDLSALKMNDAENHKHYQLIGNGK